MQHSMKTLPEAERPYEKCLAHGPANLSDAELLAVILRTGSVGESALELARRILYDPAAAPDEGLKRLVRGQVNEWMHLKGIGQVKIGTFGNRPLFIQRLLHLPLVFLIGQTEGGGYVVNVFFLDISRCDDRIKHHVSFSFKTRYV